MKPERDQNPDPKLRKEWWLFRRSNEEIRSALMGLDRYIVTVETAKHRWFEFLEASILPDNRLVVFAFDDAFFLGVLSSRIHVVFTLATGGTLEDRPIYSKSRCFDTFPFPDCARAQRERIRTLAEKLDAHRKRVQAEHGLTLTGMYNVLEKLRADAPLSDKEKLIHDKGLVSVLKQLHDDLDAAVFAAYGWPVTLTDAEILERLVALNAERAREEAEGTIRWLRPEYQNPAGKHSATPSLRLVEKPAPKPKSTPRAARRPHKKQPWPKTMAQRVKAVSVLIKAAKAPVTAAEVAERFLRASPADINEILETLCAMGHAHKGKQKGTYLP